MKNYGNKIKKLRINHGLTLLELGKKIDMNYSNMSKIERGDRQPTLELLETLSTFYNVPISYFFDDKYGVTEEVKKFDPEWISFLEEMEDKQIKPDEIRAILSIMRKLKIQTKD